MTGEIWDLYDARGNKTDRTMVRGEEVPFGLYHIAVHIWPVNSRGEYLVQKRAPTVQWNPNCWAVTGGSAVSGEDALSAAVRELGEELGYHAEENELTLIARLRRSNSFCHVYSLKTDLLAEDFILQKEEVSAVKWCTREQIHSMIADNMLYNYGDSYFRMLFDYHQSRR